MGSSTRMTKTHSSPKRGSTLSVSKRWTGSLLEFIASFTFTDIRQSDCLNICYNPWHRIAKESPHWWAIRRPPSATGSDGATCATRSFWPSSVRHTDSCVSALWRGSAGLGDAPRAHTGSTRWTLRLFLWRIARFSLKLIHCAQSIEVFDLFMMKKDSTPKKFRSFMDFRLEIKTVFKNFLFLNFYCNKEDNNAVYSTFQFINIILLII